MSYGMRITLLLGFIFMSLPSLAATGPTITSVAGASGFIGTGTPTIYGGLAGDKGNPPDIYTPANSCAVAPTCTTKPLCPCNTQRIYDGLVLTIGLSNQATDANGATTNPTVGNAYVTVTSTGGGSTTSSTTPISLINTNNGGTSVSMYWTTLCTLAGAQSCEDVTASGATISINIYSDTNNNGQDPSTDGSTAVNIRILKPDPATYSTYGSQNKQGIGTFTPYPGDGKIYIKDPETTSDFPYLGYTANIKSVRVFTSETNLTEATPEKSSKTVDLAVSDDGGSLAKNIVDGLTNGTRYYFRLGMVDEAQNVVMFTGDPAVDEKAKDAECTTPSGGATSSCQYSAAPAEVQGLLPDDFNCFVATAAYGSFLEPKLMTFREFRKRILLSTAFGRRLNLAYYHYGPYAARFIGDKPALRALTRAALWPAFGLSWLSLRFGFTSVLLALVTVIAGTVTLVRRGTRSRA